MMGRRNDQWVLQTRLLINGMQALIGYHSFTFGMLVKY